MPYSWENSLRIIARSVAEEIIKKGVILPAIDLLERKLDGVEFNHFSFVPTEVTAQGVVSNWVNIVRRMSVPSDFFRFVCTGRCSLVSLLPSGRLDVRFDVELKYLLFVPSNWRKEKEEKEAIGEGDTPPASGGRRNPPCLCGAHH